MKLYVWRYVIEEFVGGTSIYFVLLALANDLAQAKKLLHAELTKRKSEIEPRVFQEMVETIDIAQDIDAYEVPTGVILEV